ncbi:ferrous iron transport protein B [Kordiimonas sediminis]|uniref:Ferrous iron transport protein B n=1 Tax=Kordiimonas sediminis TaxID=1735581 RepID=A0A919AX10_9PROT|nr:ferrous iron transporter B [Kordiimonas sediminis]GHF30350.1 ferrous iron transport protein B [Kordiimonas sediminis]
MNHPVKVAVVGNPNCGKSALFNSLTGLRQKVANYPGATVERRSGSLLGMSTVELLDLPGTYSLTPRSPDEEITRATLMGELEAEDLPRAILCVVDATNLSQHLRFVLELKDLGFPMVLALNMTDLAVREKINIDRLKLEQILGIPVVETVAVRKKGLDEIREKLLEAVKLPKLDAKEPEDVRSRQNRARDIKNEVTLSEGIGHKATRVLDTVFLNMFVGPLILFGLLFLIFQAVFSWAEAPMDMIDGFFGSLQDMIAENMSDGLLASFLSDGLIAGVGSVIIFLPQILILFAFILVLESSGYMVRAAFLMDRIMSRVGLNGRAFIPLISSFACAIPGIMSARAIADPSDRLTTILIAPLMTCSARLPVYTLIIAAFIPNTTIFGGTIGLQGFVMFILYLAGILSALIIAFVLKRSLTKSTPPTFMMELPKYQVPNWRYVGIGLYERSRIFLRRAGTMIMGAMVILWVLSTFPAPPADATEPAIVYSMVGIIGGWLEPIFAPIGFNWEISIALLPGMAAREIAVAALGTVYSLQGSEDVVAGSLVSMLNGAWSLPTALSFLAWFIFAPQCLSTIAVVRRETNSRKWTAFMVAYLFGLAYLSSFLTYHIASAIL